MKRRAARRGSPLRWAAGRVWRADPRGALLAGLLQLIGAVSGLGVVIASRLAIQAVSGPGGGASGRLTGALVILAVSGALSQSMGSVQQLQQRLLTERVNQEIWDDLIRTTVSVPLEQWQRADFMDRVERVRMNALYRPATVVTSAFTVAGAAIGAVGLVAALLAIEPILVPLLLLVGAPALLLSRRASALEFGFAVRSNPIIRRTGYLKRLMTERPGAAELRSFGAAPFLLRRHARGNAEYLAELRRHTAARLRLGLLTTGVTTLTLGLTFGLIGYLLITDRLSLADAGAAAIAARLLSNQLGSMFLSVGGLVECVPFIEDLRDFATLEDAAGATPGRPRPLREAVTVDDVTFAYPGSDRLALAGVSMRLPAGQVVAVVGENGSGKTTLAKVVAGLFTSRTGSVAWDGDAAIDLADLRASINVLFQDFVRYQMTAADNIAIARAGEVDEEAIGRAAERASVADTLARLPDGLNTMLGLELAEGSELSGGQWQRLALARAFYRDADLIVLDEPSAALDPRAEWELFRDVRRVLDGRAALLISHRYSSVQLADYIYVMDAGRVIEEGTHTELLSLPHGRYAELYALQAAAYLDHRGLGTTGTVEQQTPTSGRPRP